MKTHFERILVLRGGALGDFILTLPVLNALRQYYCGCHLEIVGNPSIAPLAISGGLANRMVSLESPRLATFFGRTGELDSDWSNYFQSFSLILSYLSDPDDIFHRRLQSQTAARIIRGTFRPEEFPTKHATESLLQPLVTMGICHGDPEPRLQIPARATLTRRPGPWLAAHPGSGSTRKNWAENRWRQLLDRLAEETEWNLLLVGGDVEGDRLQRLARALPAARVQVAQNWPLWELASQLAACQGFIGHDSGITHLAAALGLHGLVLWGPTNPVVWRPRSARMQLLHAAGGLDTLEVTLVFHRLRHLLSDP